MVRASLFDGHCTIRKPDQAWQQTWVASGNSMACGDLKLADLDRDGRLDITASVLSTKNVVIYWNRTPVP